ncbi:MAG TPA: hypothetical protein VIQ97_06560 [Prevotella sp.]
MKRKEKMNRLKQLFRDRPKYVLAQAVLFIVALVFLFLHYGIAEGLIQLFLIVAVVCLVRWMYSLYLKRQDHENTP